MIERKIQEINSLKHQIAVHTSNDYWNDAFLERVKVDFTYNSSKIEGITLSYGQTIKLLKDCVTPQNAAPGEILDLVNHQRILDNIFKNYRSENLSVENIKILHQELMKNLEQWNDDSLYSPGKFKLFENFTARSNGKIHAYLQPSDVAEAMDKLVESTNQKLQAVNISNIDSHL